ncbi:hypothetical protein PHMEG_00033146 [Phytophthora megakarya]|uniref:Uncharacterized protein n=1 Tax=Phytophthora megakarya TaxID=4795 RepID=A0A225UU06_9STRA|nr:hypothetical protein PHMEG_00033146 [Phytophthora megakarya]
MSLKDLAPANTKRAREHAARTFLKFLKEEEVEWQYLETCMLRDNGPLILEAVVDKFGMYLAFKGGRKGKLLARHSVMQYFRQAKNWLLEQFPQHRVTVEQSLLKKGQVLERHCMKRESGAFVNKAPACTKSALKQMMKYLYSTAVTAADYQDAALLCLLWFLFGRASDLTLLRKANLSIGSGNIFFVRFIRVKTSEEQDIANTIVAQSTSRASGLPQFSVAPATPLIDLIDHPEVVLPSRAKETSIKNDQTSIKNDQNQDTVPGVHSYVNRVLDRIAGKARVAERGAWNMTATNKAFAYVFNTPSEYHKVARVLSGHDPERAVKLLSLDVFDSDTKLKLQSVAASLFNASYGLQTAPYNVNGAVIDTLFACLLRRYASLKQLRTDGLAIKRLESCAIEKGYTTNELLAWSSHITCNQSTSPQHDPTIFPSSKNDITNHPTFRQQAALIDELIQLNKKLDARMSTMEAKICNKTQPTTHERSEGTANDPPANRTGATTNLKVVWFTWCAQEPRIWSAMDAGIKHYKDNVLELGDTAEKRLLAYLASHHINARGVQNILKSLRKLHKTGHLNTLILGYKQLLAAGRIVDPAPVHTTNILELILIA